MIDQRDILMHMYIATVDAGAAISVGAVNVKDGRLSYPDAREIIASVRQLDRVIEEFKDSDERIRAAIEGGA